MIMTLMLLGSLHFGPPFSPHYEVEVNEGKSSACKSYTAMLSTMTNAMGVSSSLYDTLYVTAIAFAVRGP